MLHLKLINIRREGARPIGLRSGVVPLLEIAPQPWVATEPQSRRPHLTRLALRLRLRRPAARRRGGAASRLIAAPTAAGCHRAVPSRPSPPSRLALRLRLRRPAARGDSWWVTGTIRNACESKGQTFSGNSQPASGRFASRRSDCTRPSAHPARPRGRASPRR
jgi:hypothetical protein